MDWTIFLDYVYGCMSMTCTFIIVNREAGKRAAQPSSRIYFRGNQSSSSSIWHRHGLVWRKDDRHCNYNNDSCAKFVALVVSLMTALISGEHFPRCMVRKQEAVPPEVTPQRSISSERMAIEPDAPQLWWAKQVKESWGCFQMITSKTWYRAIQHQSSQYITDTVTCAW
jgi:hypothetical protein